MSADLTLFDGDRCPACGGPIERAATGRPATYCSANCRLQAFRDLHREEQRLHGQAHGAVARAIRDGDLERRPCAVCGESRRVDGHHHRGYGPDAILDVVFLCSRHHKAAHREAGAA